MTALKKWLCRHGIHHRTVLVVDLYCDWGHHWIGAA